jgi:Fusaric acid resistance protein-like
MPWSDVFALRAAPARSLPRAVEAVVAMGTPVAVGVALGHQAWGLTACLGAFSALYGARLSLGRRARLVFVVAAGMTACMAVGSAAAAHTWVAAAVITAVAAVAVFTCLAVGVGPPGGYMFVLVCAAATHLPAGHVGRDTALVAVGAVGAALIATAGTVIAPHLPRTAAPGEDPGAGALVGGSRPVPGTAGRLRAAMTATFDHHSPVVPAAARAALAALVAYTAAHLVGLNHAYWAAAAAVAVAGPGLHATATVRRGLDRAGGTVVGMLLAAAVFALRPHAFGLVAVLMALQFAVEILAPRNYALAVCFITPLALLISESASGADEPGLLGARFAATAVGCAIGIATTLLAPRDPGES